MHSLPSYHSPWPPLPKWLSTIGASSKFTDFSIPKITRKNVSGLSYRLMPSDRWNVSAFAKYYRQYNKGPVSQNTDGIGNYINLSNTASALGYGAAGTYFIWKDLQGKLSYEKAFRLPTTDELFGDEDLEAGKMNLKPEKSDNVNLSFSYNHQFGKHRLYAVPLKGTTRCTPRNDLFLLKERTAP